MVWCARCMQFGMRACSVHMGAFVRACVLVCVVRRAYVRGVCVCVFVCLFVCFVRWLVACVCLCGGVDDPLRF